MERFILFLLICLVWPISTASAGALEQGIQFYEQKNYVQAKESWRPLAREGDARAQYNMALLLYKEARHQYENADKASDNLPRRKADEYLAMSRSSGLVDGYVFTMPELDSIVPAKSVSKSGNKGIVSNDPLSWLNQQQKETYTLQLATGKNRQSMEKMQKKLLAGQSLEQSQNLYIQKFEKKIEGQSNIRYILIYGIFETYQDAKNAVEKLPESIQKSSPWIRKFEVIQSIVNAGQDNKNKT